MNKIVLVIENQMLNSNLVKAILEANDFQVYSCPNSDTALIHLLEKIIPLPDIIILDLSDADPFSRQFCRMSLPQKETHKIPIIVTSKNKFSDLERQDLGATAYVQHPYSLFELITVLFNCLKTSLH